MTELLDKLTEDGFVVLENFLNSAECEEMVEAAYDFTNELPKVEERIIFSSTEGNKPQLQEKYFLESNDKIRPFFEKDSLDPEGNLLVEPQYSLNKVGHALHLLHPLFRVYTYCDRVKQVVKALNFEKPAVVQSMVIYKNPRIGGEVIAHQDGTYLHTEPVPPIGFWIALQDATIENGCLWVVRGSHKGGLHRRLLRNSDKDASEKLVYNKPQPVYSLHNFQPLPVKKGTCIILHGHLVHKSNANTSDQSRLAYTFHVIETNRNTYPSTNWLQEGSNAPFQDLYSTMQLM